MRRAVVESIGHYLPERVVENSEFEATLDTNDAWIRSRTGIERRHFAAEGETTSDMGIKAAQAALANAGCRVEDVDAIILATSTADLTFPSAATMVQHGLGMNHGFAFDVQAVCAGFLFALNTANSMIASGQANRILVIGAETFSKLMDWTDRGTCVLFGDGAGAVVLRSEEGKGTSSDHGLLATCVHSDGNHYDALYVDGGVSSTQTAGHLRMQGKEVFKHAVGKLAAVASEAAAAADLTMDDIDWLVPHQANRRIMDATARKLGIAMEKLVVTVDRHANTSSASIPLALNEAVRDGRICDGDLVLLEAIGGGLVWGAGVARW